MRSNHHLASDFPELKSRITQRVSTAKNGWRVTAKTGLTAAFFQPTFLQRNAKAGRYGSACARECPVLCSRCCRS